MRKFITLFIVFLFFLGITVLFYYAFPDRPDAAVIFGVIPCIFFIGLLLGD